LVSATAASSWRRALTAAACIWASIARASLARGRQFVTRNGTAADEGLTAREVGLGLGQGRLGRSHAGLGRVDLRIAGVCRSTQRPVLRERLAVAALRGGKFGLGLGERDALVRILDPEQQLALADGLGVGDEHFHHAARRQRGHLRIVAADIGIVGRDRAAADEGVVSEIEQAHCRHAHGKADEERLAPVLAEHAPGALLVVVFVTHYSGAFLLELSS
jgi:hypothetical protein